MDRKIMKSCTKCECSLPFAEFSKNKTRADGLAKWCKKCTKNYRDQPESKVRMKEYHRQYDLARSRKPEQRLAQEGYRLKNKYGMTLADKQKMFNSQDGLCAICSHPFKKLKSSCVDHDHETGKIRKLLCKPCNSYLGMIEEDRNVAIKLIDYIDSHKTHL